MIHLDLKPGDKVRVYYLTQPPIEATVIKGPDRAGFVDLKGTCASGEYEFIALVEKCEKL